MSNTTGIGTALRSVVSLKPFDDVPDRAWAELTDPVSFVVGSIVILLYGTRASATPRVPKGLGDGWRSGLRLGSRLGPTFSVAAAALLAPVVPVLIGLVLPKVSAGNELAYAVTLLVAGAFTFLPGRVAELRDDGHVRGSGYPKRLRRAMWYCESLIEVIAVVMIVVWNFGGDGNHEIVRAVAWGLLVVSVSDLMTLNAAKIVAYAEAESAVDVVPGAGVSMTSGPREGPEIA